MGSAYIRQPNGKIARFSSFTDTFTHYDLTEDEVRANIVQEAVELALRDAEAVLKKVRKHGTSAIYRPFDLSFEAALKKHKEHGGEDFDYGQEEEKKGQQPTS
jgi:hypothetical protein